MARDTALDIKVQNGTISIGVSNTSSTDEDLKDAVLDLKMLLQLSIEADEAWKRLPSEVLEERAAAIAAQTMRYDMAIHNARAQAKVLIEIIEGSKSIGDHGFPEFVSGQN